MARQDRRRFLGATAAALGLQQTLTSLGDLRAEDVSLKGGVARFSDEIEPLVRFLEDTPRGEVLEKTAVKIRAGLPYRRLLAALLLAGVRNVQPRPSVGFKFHAVLVVNSAHLASLSSSGGDRWLPILWAVDNFKSSQERDTREGDWTMPAVDESTIPPAHLAAERLRLALESWDEAGADVAVVSMARHLGAHQTFEELARFAARDFRSIGHKVIFLANGFRTLQTIGWEYAEPVLRSLVYAMLNHNGEPNPAESDLEADRPGRVNASRIDEIASGWQAGAIDHAATVEMLATLREGTAEEAGGKVIELLGRDVSPRSVWDALFAASGELMMRQRGIVSLHAVTTSNAIHYAWQTASDDRTRRFLLLQNASFLPMFREAARGRGALADRRIDQLQPSTDNGRQDRDDPREVNEIFSMMGQNRESASRQMLAFLRSGGSPQAVADHSRRLIYLKGSDSHDYKFSSASLEDYRVLSPDWRDRFLSACSYQWIPSSAPNRPLAKRIAESLSG